MAGEEGKSCTCLKKNSQGRTNQNCRTAGRAAEAAKAESSQTVAGPPQTPAPQLLVLNFLPTAPSSIVFCNSTRTSFSLQHLTLFSFLEGLIPADSTLPNQQTQQKLFNQQPIFYQTLLTLPSTSSFPAALSKQTGNSLGQRLPCHSCLHTITYNRTNCFS